MQFLKQTVDKYARTQDGFEKRLGRARKTMIYRAQIRNQRAHDTAARQMQSKQLRQSYSRPELDVSFASPEPPVFSPSSSILSKRSSKADLSSHSSSVKEGGGGGQGKGKQGVGEGTRRKTRKKNKKVSTDTLYAVNIFYEFVRELASISEEHSVLHSLLYSLPYSTSLLLAQ